MVNQGLNITCRDEKKEQGAVKSRVMTGENQRGAIINMREKSPKSMVQKSQGKGVEANLRFGGGGHKKRRAASVTILFTELSRWVYSERLQVKTGESVSEWGGRRKS